jgi:hypothetical protein
LEAFLEEEAAREERERPTILSFVIDGEDAETVEKAIRISQQAEAGGISRGRALVGICKEYVNSAVSSNRQNN